MQFDFRRIFHPTKAEQISDLERVIFSIKSTYDYENNHLYCKNITILDNSLYCEPIYVCKLTNQQCTGKCENFCYNQALERLEQELVTLKNNIGGDTNE